MSFVPPAALPAADEGVRMALAARSSVQGGSTATVPGWEQSLQEFEVEQSWFCNVLCVLLALPLQPASWGLRDDLGNAIINFSDFIWFKR